MRGNVRQRRRASDLSTLHSFPAAAPTQANRIDHTSAAARQSNSGGVRASGEDDVRFTNVSTAVPTSAPTQAAVNGETNRNSAILSNGSLYKDGTFTGDPADANWGLVEVNVVISNGSVVDVQFLQYPNHRSRSRSINDQAMPILSQEAIQAQDANVDLVSGATDTSEAFVESLATALNRAAA